MIPFLGHGSFGPVWHSFGSEIHAGFEVYALNEVM
jgi:hypothetical protein